MNTMTTINERDFIESVSDALQYISYYHPPDFLKALTTAYETEKSKPARDAIAQILVNSKMCALGHRPLCQDTGIVTVFIDVGMAVTWSGGQSLEALVNCAVSAAYRNAENPLRASIVADPAGKRSNTGDNTPAVVHTRLVPGNQVSVTVCAKGGGSENKAKLAMLNPSDSIVDWVLETVPGLGAGWCPPGVLGIGIGGTAEKAMLLAKEALMEPIDIQQLQAKSQQLTAGETLSADPAEPRPSKNGKLSGSDPTSPQPLTTVEKLRLELYEKVNALGIGAQGLGGLTTVLDVKIRDYPTHATSKPVAMIPNCAATRHLHFTLDGSGPAKLPTPRLEDWPDIHWSADKNARRVNLNNLNKKDLAAWQPGETLLLSGTLLTGRDAAHKRLIDLLKQGQPLPAGVDFTNKFIYYVGPVDPVGDEAVGPAGPTTATRMDKFTDAILSQTGIIGMIGKAERGSAAITAIKKHQSAYLIATGGAAYLISKAIKTARVVAFADLGMEAIHEFEVVDMPVTVAVDSRGTSVHKTGPREWRVKIENLAARKT